ncbi:hypothetical protein D3C81_1009250 [compost metagenome]
MAIDIVGPAQARLEVDAGEHPRILPDSLQPVAPGIAGGEAVVLAIARTAAGLRPWSEQRVATIAPVQLANVDPSQLADQGQAAGPHQLIETVFDTGLQLADGMPAIGGLGRAAGQAVGDARLQRRVGPMAEFAAPDAAAGQGGGEAQAIQADVLGVGEDVAVAGQAEQRQATVVVEHIGAEVGGQRLVVIVQGQAELAGVAGFAIGAARQRRAGGPRQLVAAVGQVVGLGQEGGAVVLRGRPPLQLVEDLQRQRITEALRPVQQVDRQAALAQRRIRPAPDRRVERVDRIDAAGDQPALAPVQHLPADAQAAGLLADDVVAPGEGLQPFGAGRLGAALAAVVVEVGERPAFVLQLEVVPVAAADKQAAVAAPQLQRVNAAEALAEGFAALEVEPAIVAARCRRAAAIAGADQVAVGAVGGPARGQRQLRIELSLERPDIEGHGLRRRGQAAGQQRHPHRQCSVYRHQRNSPDFCSGPQRRALSDNWRPLWLHSSPACHSAATPHAAACSLSPKV